METAEFDACRGRMQRNIVENGKHIVLFHKIDECASLLHVLCLDIEHVTIVHTLLRHIGKLYFAGLRKRTEQPVILIPSVKSHLIDLLCHLKLGI